MLLRDVNSDARCTPTSSAIRLLRMAKKRRKPLEPWQKEDSDRLLDLWNKAKDANPHLSQRQFAEDNHIGDESQGIVWQYTHGVIPLNVDVAIKFANGLKCNVADFSPRLEAERERLAAEGGQLALPDQLSASMAQAILAYAAQLSAAQQNALLHNLKQAVEANEVVKTSLKIPELRHAADSRVADALKPVSRLHDNKPRHRKTHSRQRSLPLPKAKKDD